MHYTGKNTLTSISNTLTPDLDHTSAHFKELRTRVILSLLFFVISASICGFFSNTLLSLAVKPLAKVIYTQGHGPQYLVFSTLGEGFAIHFRIAVISGFLLSVPFILWQFYAFIEPGLYRHEKSFVRPYFFASPFLFLLGLFFTYSVIMPISWRFFISFESIVNISNDVHIPIVLQAKISEYLSTSITLILAFGLAFQFPLVILALGKSGLITPKSLIKHRKIAIILIFILAAILTPPDVISQILLAIPLLFLYELAIFLLGGYKKSGATHNS